MKQLHIILHTTQVTQVASLLEVQTKTIIDIDYEHLGPKVAIVPSIYALYMWRAMITFG